MNESIQRLRAEVSACHALVEDLEDALASVDLAFGHKWQEMKQSAVRSMANHIDAKRQSGKG